MPADARSLLRAAASSQAGTAGIADRHASYHPKTKALRCAACQYQPIKHESLWPSHAASKSHRANVQQIEEGERRRALTARHDDDIVEASGDSVDDTHERSKRKASKEGPDQLAGKRPKSNAAGQPGISRPMTLDLEWERFQAEVLDAPIAGGSSASNSSASNSSYLVDATIKVQPLLREESKDARKGDAGAVSNRRSVGAPTDAKDERAEDMILDPSFATESVEGRRQRLEREAREEILARLEEEQRVQEEAEDRVRALKERLERMRHSRAARKP